MALAYAPDGNILVAGGEGGALIAWDTAEGSRLWKATIANPAEVVPATQPGVRRILFSPDGTRPMTFRIQFGPALGRENWKSFRQVDAQGEPYRMGTRDSVAILRVDGKFLVISDFPSNLVIWNLDSLE